jgi:hypothetical protein
MHVLVDGRVVVDGGEHLGMHVPHELARTIGELW